MEKIEGQRVNVIFDDYTMHLEDLYFKQHESDGKPAPNRSSILRVVYRKFLQGEIDIFKANELWDTEKT